MAMKTTINMLSGVATFGFSTLIMLGAYSSPVHATSLLCETSQASSEELSQLASNCPIGQGNWNNKAPTQKHDFYWIQCGFLSHPLTPNRAKNLSKQVSMEIWIKPEDNGYRCLIGPYSEYVKAAEELAQVASITAYKDSFIRMVGDGSRMVEVVDSKEDKLKKVEPEKMVTTPESINLQSSSVEIRLHAIINGKVVVIPYLTDRGDHQGYIESGQFWTRLNYAQSKQVCAGLGMRLAQADEFVVLRDADVMQHHGWPMQLPYWGEERYGLFMEQQPRQLAETSLLNVMCIKS